MNNLLIILIILGIAVTYTIYQVNENTNDILNLEAQVNGISTYNNTTTKPLTTQERYNIIALCDPGDFVTGGGGSIIPIDTKYTLLDSKPISNLTGYNVTVIPIYAGGVYTAYAICLDLTP